MTLDEAIKLNKQKITELDIASKHQMAMYQTGHINKEQHNEIQSAINKKRLAMQLGIEALKAWQECRRKGLVPLGWVLPSETEDKGET